MGIKAAYVIMLFYILDQLFQGALAGGVLIFDDSDIGIL